VAWLCLEGRGQVALCIAVRASAGDSRPQRRSIGPAKTALGKGAVRRPSGPDLGLRMVHDGPRSLPFPAPFAEPIANRGDRREGAQLNHFVKAPAPCPAAGSAGAGLRSFASNAAATIPPTAPQAWACQEIP
jgi:hypothetical protein